MKRENYPHTDYIKRLHRCSVSIQHVIGFRHRSTPHPYQANPAELQASLSPIFAAPAHFPPAQSLHQPPSPASQPSTTHSSTRCPSLKPEPHPRLPQNAPSSFAAQPSLKPAFPPANAVP